MAKSATPVVKSVAGQPSWVIGSTTTQACITRVGGHLGPVTFTLAGKKIAPLSVAPWATEKLPKSAPNLMRVLRGDFFCMPFGGNARAYRGEVYPAHGETAHNAWTLENYLRTEGGTSIHLSLKTKIRKAQVDKIVTLRDGHTAVYQEHAIWGMKGKMSMGHHAMLKFPDRPGSGLVATSRMLFGQVYPAAFELPENGGYQSLVPGAEFDTLEKVPTVFGGTADLSRYPARRGFEDIVLMGSDPKLPFAWTAVTFPKERFVWFALKDPRILPCALFWISNGGRHYAPWSSRHVNVMGLEEICSYFHAGLAESAEPNGLNERGIGTTHTLDPQTPFHVPYIMAVAKIPAGFDHVADIEQTEEGVVLSSRSGKQARTGLDLSFLAPEA